MAQTRAGLRSTASVANVTAKNITGLASSISKMTGIDDEAVQASENMLLTFTKVRNEVGKGNNVFDQATLAVANMATKMNNGAIPSMEQLSTSSIAIGKALNDPIKGVTSLTKRGVQFTDEQKKMIAALVKSGDRMGAQKIILKELATQFGGAAKAAGQTLGGMLARMRNRFDEFAGGLVGRVIPALTSFFQEIDKAKGFQAKLAVVWTGIQEAGRTLTAKLREAMAAVDWNAVWSGARGIGAGLQARFETIDWTAVGKAVGEGISKGITFTGDAAKRLADSLLQLTRSIDWTAMGKAMGPGLAAALVMAFVSLTSPSWWIKNWDLALAVGLVAFRVKIFAWAGKLAGAALAPLGNAGRGMVLAITGAIESASPRIASALLTALLRLPGIATTALAKLVAPVRTAFNNLSRLAQFTIKVLGVQAAISAVGSFVGKVKAWITQLNAWLDQQREALWASAVSIGRAIIDGIVAGIYAAGGAIKSALTSIARGALNEVKKVLLIRSPSLVFAQQVGKPIGEGIAKGIADSGPRVTAALRGVLMQALRSKNFGTVSSVISSLFAEKQGGVLTKSEKKIAGIERGQTLADLALAIKDAAGAVLATQAIINAAPATIGAAQAGLATAQAGGDPAEIAAAQDILDAAVAARDAAVAQLVADQRAEARAKQDLVLFHLREKAEKERARLEKAQFVAQLKLTARLEGLQKLFDKQHVTIGQLLAALKKILRSLKIPGFAGGVQNFRGGLAVVGEKGPELVNLPRGSDVHPSGSGGVINVHFHSLVPSTEDQARQVIELASRGARAQSFRGPFRIAPGV